MQLHFGLIEEVKLHAEAEAEWGDVISVTWLLVWIVVDIYWDQGFK